MTNTNETTRAITELITRNEHYLNDLDEGRARVGSDLARAIRNGGDAVSQIRMAQNTIDDLNERMAERRGILTGLKTARDIAEAASGEFSYTTEIHRGYEITVRQFAGEQERAAFLESDDNWAGAQAATAAEAVQAIMAGGTVLRA